jgi:hypothetical protein
LLRWIEFGESDISILNRLRQLGIIYKEIVLYKERDEEKHKAFTNSFDKNQAKDLIFVDEIGINYKDIKEYTWSEKGIRVIGERCETIRHRWTTVIAGIRRKTIMAPFRFDYYTNVNNFCI